MKNSNDLLLTTEYRSWLKDLKEKVRLSQIKAAVKVNSTLLEFYWELGADIIDKQKSAAWGSGFLDQLSRDLVSEFKEMKGFSKNNLQYIVRWYLFYNKDDVNVEQVVPYLFQIPWGQNLQIISKCKTENEAIYYVFKTIENGWSRAVLTHQIECGLYGRSGKAITNFSEHLPKPQSDLAKQLLKDPYNFDFLTLTENYKERELEQGLVEHMTQFLLELGGGFAYVGKQVEITVGDRDFYIDLLFYHTKLRCYVVIELKAVEFEPEHAGKLNFYLAAVDGELKHELDAPSIGILLCKSKNKTVVEYALRDINSPIGVSEYELTQSLPEELQSSLPSIEEIEAELGEYDE